MIKKELSEIIDALARESGESMLPYQELELLGYGPQGESNCIHRSSVNFTADDEDDEEYDDDDYDADDESRVDEEYEFDDDDEEYSLLSKVLRLNNCRKKYLA